MDSIKKIKHLYDDKNHLHYQVTSFFNSDKLVIKIFNKNKKYLHKLETTKNETNYME